MSSIKLGFMIVCRPTVAAKRFQVNWLFC